MKQRESDFELRRDSLVIEEADASDEKKRIAKEKRAVEDKSKKLKKLENELNAKLSNVAMSEKKLKDYAKLMKKQTKDVREKDENLKNLAKILNDKKYEMDNNSAAVSELELLLEDEQERYQDLLRNYERLQLLHEQNQLNARTDSFEGTDETAEARIQQMALRIKEKDDELTKKQLVLEDKLAKCDECESTLAAWQSELESVAAAVQN